jgi:FkbM family methyltransferase
MLDKGIKKGQGPVYQQLARTKSIDFVKEKKLALDIGANVGLWSRDLCQHFTKVIAIEPITEFCNCLKLNVPAKNLEILSLALGAEDTQVEMIMTPENTGHTHVNPQSIGQGSVKMCRLDSLNLPHIDYIKIDCEGYENYILIGAHQTIVRDRPIIVIEDKKHKDVGHNQSQGAVQRLQEWGAVILDRVRNDVILGWA